MRIGDGVGRRRVVLECAEYAVSGRFVAGVLGRLAMARRKTCAVMRGHVGVCVEKVIDVWPVTVLVAGGILEG